MTDILSWSAVDTARRLRNRDVSVTEVTQAHLDRIDAINPKINAITEVSADAMDLAARMDAAHPGEGAPPLWGVPVTTKINTDQIGYANSNGLAALADAICEADAPVVANLKAAGAVIIGRSNTPEFSLRWCTSNPLHGVSLNPWDATATPGGSSGGAAAAVACGIGALAHGNDLGGSLRYPAFCNGVATIRPSQGRIPAYNPSAAAERPPVTQTMSVQGPIARSIADVRLGLDAMRTRSSMDPYWSSSPDSGRTRGDKTTIGFCTHPFAVEMDDPAIDTAMRTAVDGARAAGMTMVEMPFPGADRAAELWGDILFTETEILMRETIEQLGSPDMQQLVVEYEDYYRRLDLEGFIRALAERGALQRQVSLMFDDIDLFLMPTSLLRPFRNDLDFTDPSSVPHILRAQKPLHAVNFLGLPAVSIPTNVVDGLPVGVQLIAPMHDDDFALDIAARIETVIGTIIGHCPLA